MFHEDMLCGGSDKNTAINYRMIMSVFVIIVKKNAQKYIIAKKYYVIIIII